MFEGGFSLRIPVSPSDSGIHVTIVFTIALGIGANIAAYNVVYNVLLRPLPFRDSARLVQLWETTPALPQLQIAVPDFEDWRQQARRFEEISAYTFQAMNRMTMIGPGEPEVVQATMVTHDLFSTLGIHPVSGRDFTTEDEQRKQKVALISENLWRRKFGTDPAIGFQRDVFQVSLQGNRCASSEARN